MLPMPANTCCPLRLALLFCFSVILALSQPASADTADHADTKVFEPHASPCEFSINPTAYTFDPDGEDLYVVVEMDVPCDWTVAGVCEWAVAERLDDGTARVSVSANTGPARSCDLMIAGQTFTARQEAAAYSPTIFAEPHVVQIGAPINVWFSGAPGDAGDWIALYREDAGEKSRAYAEHRYLQGEHEGQLTFTAPMDPGVYEFRMFCCWPSGGYSEIATSNRVEVVLYFEDGDGPTLFADPPEVLPGEPITVVFRHAPGNDRDWVSIYREGARNEDYGEWHYLQGEREGQLTFTAPREPGVYEFRMFCCWAAGRYYDIARSNTIVVREQVGSTGTVRPGAITEFDGGLLLAVHPDAGLDAIVVDVDWFALTEPPGFPVHDDRVIQADRFVRIMVADGPDPDQVSDAEADFLVGIPVPSGFDRSRLLALVYAGDYWMPKNGVYDPKYEVFVVSLSGIGSRAFPTRLILIEHKSHETLAQAEVVEQLLDVPATAASAPKSSTRENPKEIRYRVFCFASDCSIVPVVEQALDDAWEHYRHMELMPHTGPRLNRAAAVPLKDLPPWARLLISEFFNRRGVDVNSLNYIAGWLVEWITETRYYEYYVFDEDSSFLAPIELPIYIRSLELASALDELTGVFSNVIRGWGQDCATASGFYFPFMLNLCVTCTGWSNPARTTAHELLHAIQWGYRRPFTLPNYGVIEATARLMEDISDPISVSKTYSTPSLVVDVPLLPEDVSLLSPDSWALGEGVHSPYDREYFYYDLFHRSTGLTSYKDLGYLFDIGLKTADLDQFIARHTEFGGLSEAYWRWARNAAFEGDVLLPVKHTPSFFTLPAGALPAFLDAEVIPVDLHNQFSSHGHTLAPNAQVHVEVTGVAWAIDDGSTEYAIRRVEDAGPPQTVSLHVYLRLPIYGPPCELKAASLTGGTQPIQFYLTTWEQAETTFSLMPLTSQVFEITLYPGPTQLRMSEPKPYVTAIDVAVQDPGVKHKVYESWTIGTDDACWQPMEHHRPVPLLVEGSPETHYLLVSNTSFDSSADITVTFGEPRHNRIHDITFDPQQPASLHTGQQIEVNFGYLALEWAVYVSAVPLSDGSVTPGATETWHPGWYRSPLSEFPYEGRGRAWFPVPPGHGTIDAIRLRMHDFGRQKVLHEVIVPVNYLFQQDECDLVVRVEGEGYAQGRYTPPGLPDIFAQDVIGCSPTLGPCWGTFEFGSRVELTVYPEADWVFDGWTGDCDGKAETLTLFMDRDMVCTAVFREAIDPDDEEPLTTTDGVTLRILGSGWGRGRVFSSVEGIDCIIDAGVPSGDCQASFTDGILMLLTADPYSVDGAPPVDFVGWSGDCSGTQPTAAVLMDGNKTCIAEFQPREFDLQVQTDGAGEGHVTSHPGGIDCPDTHCWSSFLRGAAVTLTATPDGDSVFVRWEGHCSGVDPTTTLTMGDDEPGHLATYDCTAIFEPRIRQVTFEPPPPATMAFLQYVRFEFRYSAAEPEGIRILAQPMTAGSPSPNWASSDFLYPSTADGKGKGWFTITEGVTPVDVEQVRLQVWDARRQQLLHEMTVDVRFTFSEGPCSAYVQPGVSIQAVIDGAPEGALICLAEGSWSEESVEIGKSLTLRGAGSDRTAIVGRGTAGPVVHIRGDDIIVSIVDLAVSPSSYSVGPYPCVLVTGTPRVFIARSAIQDSASAGISLSAGSRSNISQTTIRGNLDGISIADSAETWIWNNVIMDNSRYGVAVLDPECFPTTPKFQGYVAGGGNTFQRNAQGDQCPSILHFLETQTGDELDWRE